MPGSISIRDVLSSRTNPDGKQRHGFFSPQLKDERKQWAKLTLLTFGLLTVVMFLFLSIYFGSYYRQVPRASHFSIEVLDLDSAASPSSEAHPAILGPAVETAIQNAVQREPHLGWYLADDATVQQFRLTPDGRGLDPFQYAVGKVNTQDVWGVLIVNANATNGVWDALTGGAEWSRNGSMTFVYEEARNFYGVEQYVSRLSTMLMRAAGDAGATTLASQVLALGNSSAVLAAAPEGSLIGAFSYNEHNLHPFDQLAFTFLISVTWNNKALPLIADKLTLGSEVLIKLLVPFIGKSLAHLFQASAHLAGYFWLSLHYSLVSLAFLVTFSRKYGKGGFVLYWMSNWVTMSALGFVMETVFLWLGPFFPFFLVFWVILNVSVAFLDIGDMASFYGYGYAFPIWNLVDMSKSIIFGTKNHLAQNFAVNLGWLSVWLVLLAVTVVYQRGKKETARMKKVWEEMKRKDEDRVLGKGHPPSRDV
ncbi:hypothetical protein DB88DRAFT_547225 [Papiliotrema laurentii]|uniref:DUF3533 domain-containing protein n=1 Tax=Papiliotrema laurentii TaxID=5418 RepID=A0AAD9FQI6_PAPLA|nr:hypothetical protein DB88DRAFT_547225 [Papiliotrema laurentii]